MEDSAISVSMVTGMSPFEVIDLDALTFANLVDVVIRVRNAEKAEQAVSARASANASKDDFLALLKQWEDKRKVEAQKPKLGLKDLIRDFGTRI